MSGRLESNSKPILPPTSTDSPEYLKISARIAVVVVFPADPVIPTTGT